MQKDKKLGAEIHAVSRRIHRRLNSILSEHDAMDLTPMQGRILGYLHTETKRDVYQKDIEAEFSITRSTVTSVLQLMEKHGYIRRESVPHDARLKKIVCTPLGDKAFARIDSSIHQIEGELRDALSPQEHDLMMELLGRLKHTLN